MNRSFILRIYRGTPGHQYFEEFELPYRPHENVISALMEIRKRPVNREGKKVAPVVWEDGCLEEVCGSCSMLVNGRPRQACTALIDNCLQEGVITLAPFTKFPLIRDLMIDRSIMFENLKRVHGWIEGEKSSGFGPPVHPAEQELMYTLSTCMTCGCCSESCPQVNERSTFMGPAPIAQVQLFNTHPTGKAQGGARLHALMQEGGITGCGNAQNCVRVCPKNIPLTDAIAVMGRDVTVQSFRDLFNSEK